jgi:hypothetical protein
MRRTAGRILFEEDFDMIGSAEYIGAGRLGLYCRGIG